eukprot:609249-Prorocentrum_minimum.AAC.3
MEGMRDWLTRSVAATSAEEEAGPRNPLAALECVREMRQVAVTHQSPGVLNDLLLHLRERCATNRGRVRTNRRREESIFLRSEPISSPKTFMSPGRRRRRSEAAGKGLWGPLQSAGISLIASE